MVKYQGRDPLTIGWKLESEGGELLKAIQGKCVGVASPDMNCGCGGSANGASSSAPIPAAKGVPRVMLVPLPICELFAEGDFLKFANRGAGNGVNEDEGVGELPFGEGLREEGAQFFRCCASAILQ